MVPLPYGGVHERALADDPYPAEAFHQGTYHRLRVDSNRILCYIDGDVIIIERVDRVT